MYIEKIRSYKKFVRKMLMKLTPGCRSVSHNSFTCSSTAWKCPNSQNIIILLYFITTLLRHTSFCCLDVNIPLYIFICLCEKEKTLQQFSKSRFVVISTGIQELCDSYNLSAREYYFDRSPRFKF